MGVMSFLVKNCWTLSTVWAGVLINHIMKQVNELKESSKKKKKKIAEAELSLLNNTSWFTPRGGFLEHSPSRGSLYYKGTALQKIILFLGGGGPPS